MNKKVELHLHLDGSVRPETILDLGIEQNLFGQRTSLKKIRKKVSITSKDITLEDYLKKFEIPIEILQTKKNLERVSYELVEDLALENTIYAEIRVAPVQHLKGELDPEGVIQAILEGFKRGMSQYPIKVNLLLCAMRHIPQEHNFFIIGLADKYKNLGVVGLDLAGDEAKYPVTLFKDFFEKAKSENIPFTIHAGEASGGQSVVDAINLGARRIGHGINAYKDVRAIDLIFKYNVCLECCPISNRDTHILRNFENYPFLNYHNLGIDVTINSDNRTVSSTNYNKEINFLREYFTISDDDINQFNINALNHAFINNIDRKELLAKLEKEN